MQLQILVLTKVLSLKIKNIREINTICLYNSWHQFIDKKNLLAKTSIFVLYVVKLGLTSVWNNISPIEQREVKCWMTASIESSPIRFESLEIKVYLYYV